MATTRASTSSLIRASISSLGIARTTAHSAPVYPTTALRRPIRPFHLSRPSPASSSFGSPSHSPSGPSYPHEPVASKVARPENTGNVVAQQHAASEQVIRETSDGGDLQASAARTRGGCGAGGGGGGEGGGGPSHERGGAGEKRERSGFFNSTAAETALGTSLGIVLLGFAGTAYVKWYKWDVQRKMKIAFQPGNDPCLALLNSGAHLAHVDLVDRPERKLVDEILQGKMGGHYYLIMGTKGQGKATMLLDAMKGIDADGVAYFDCHPDPAVTIDRFSEAINFTNNRDYLGNLLGLSDLSNMLPNQCLERALHKLEKAVLEMYQTRRKPVVIVMNAAHLLPNDEDGWRLLTLFQQRAEAWASAGAATFVITTDDYWVYDRCRKTASRMDVITFNNLNREQAFHALRECRRQYWGDEAAEAVTDEQFNQIYQIVGGRLNLINMAARKPDMLLACQHKVRDEEAWILSKTSIIEDHDDDVMDEQKWSTCSWLLFSELARRQAEGEKKIAEEMGEEAATKVLVEPKIPWGEVRQIMTRPDYIGELDHINAIHINSFHEVSAENTVLLRVFRKISEQDGFADKLERVMDRVAAIESLGRTRELLWKDVEEKNGPTELVIRKKGGWLW